jgi:hypothetical protein
MSRLVALVLGLSLIFGSVAACGGGSGGGGGGSGVTISDATFTGSYVSVNMIGSLATTRSEARWGRFDSAGAGMVIPSVATNVNSVFAAAAVMPALAYTVDQNALMTLPGETGAITADGAAALLTSNVAATNPSMRFLMRTSGVYNAASFTGSFHMASIVGHAGISGQAFCSTTAQGFYTPDGISVFTAPAMLTNNLDGVVSATPDGGALAYGMAANGDLTLNLFGLAMSGGLSPDGTFALVGGSNNNVPAAAALIKVAAGANNATFSGSYLAVGISSDPLNARAWTSFVGTVTADGAGVMNYIATTENAEGTITNPAGPDAYGVGADGTLISGTRIGAISQDGRYAMLCGETAATSSPTFFLFVRQ